MEDGTTPNVTGLKRAREGSPKTKEPAAKRQKIEEEELKSSVANN